MSTNSFSNVAFISYKREDEKWAKWLQYKLEHYRLPSEILKKNPNIEFSRKPRHVFKDTTDLSGGLLEEEIRKALDSSKYLIVICSPRASQSPWVCKEVQHFIDIGREEYIIPFIIDGKPNASNPEEECFPEGLRLLSDEREILGININEMGRDATAIKVIARMFGLRFDTLWQRHERAKRRRNFMYVVLLIISILIAGAMVYLAQKAEKQAKLANENKEKAEIQRNKALALIAKQYISEDSYGACIIALELLKRDINNVDAEAVLREASLINNITLRGHSSWTNSISFSSDSLYIASSSDDKTIRIWNLEDGRCLRKEAFKSSIIGVHYLPQSNNIISVTEDGNISIFDSKNNKIVKSKSTPMISDIEKSCLSRNGKKLVLADNYGNITVIDVEDLKVIKKIKTDRYLYSNTNMAISSDGTLLYYTFDSSLCKVSINSDSEVKKTYKNHTGYEIGPICLSPDNSKIMIVSSNQLKILDSDLNEIKSIANESPTAIAYTNPNIAITGYDDGLIKVWDLYTYTPKHIFKANTKGISEIIMHPSNRYIAYIGRDINGDIKILDGLYLYGTSYYTTPFYFNSKGFVASADLAAFEQTPHIAIANFDSLIFYKFNYNNNLIEPYRVDSISKFRKSKIQFSPSGKYLVACGEGENYHNKIMVWDTKTGELLKSSTATNESIKSFSFLNDVSDILAFISDTELKIWNIENNNALGANNLITEKTFDITNYTDCISSGIRDDIVLDNNYNLYEIGESETSISKINLLTNEMSNLGLNVNSRYINHISISPDNKHLAISDADLKITIFDLINNKVINSWVAHSSIIKELKWHPSGRYLISSSSDDKTKVWSVSSGICVFSMPGQLKDVNFTKDGQMIYGVYENHNFMGFTFYSTPYLVNSVSKRFKVRTLTPLEKQVYHME